MNRKLIAIALAVLTLLVLTAGCTGNQGSTTTAATSTNATTKAGATTKANATTAAATTTGATTQASNFNETGYPIVKEPVSYRAIWQQAAIHGDMNEMELYQYMEEVTNVQVEYEAIPAADWATKLNLTLASNVLPDFFYSPVGVDNIQKYGIEGKMFLDYSDMLEQYMPNFMAVAAEKPEVLSAVTMLDGSVYCLPYAYDTATAAGFTLYYRNDHLEKAGVTPPTSIEEFVEVCRKLKTTFGDEYYPVLPSTIETWIGCIFGAFGDDWTHGYGDDDGDGVYTLNRMSEQYRRMLTHMNLLYKEGLLEKEIFTMDAATIIAKSQEGKTCFYNFGTSLSLDHYESGKIETRMLDPMTSEFTAEKKITDYLGVTMNGMTISSKCANPEILLRWADLFFDENETVPGIAGGMSMWLGIKDKHWKLSDDGKTYGRIMPANSELTEVLWGVKYNATGSGWGNLLCMYPPINNPTQEMKANESLAHYFPFIRDASPDSILKYTDEEASELAALSTDIDTYLNNSRDGFISGTLGLDQWDAYLANLEKMGIKDVLKIKQAAYDRYKAMQ